MSKRIVSNAPRLVGKPLSGEDGTPQAYSAELLKQELQRYLEDLNSSLNQLQEDVEDIQTGNSPAIKFIHPFLTMGA